MWKSEDELKLLENAFLEKRKGNEMQVKTTEIIRKYKNREKEGQYLMGQRLAGSLTL